MLKKLPLVLKKLPLDAEKVTFGAEKVTFRLCYLYNIMDTCTR